MTPSCRALSATVLFPTLLIFAWSGRAQPASRPEISSFAVPIRTDLGPISAEVEKRVESKFKGSARESGIDIDYDVARDPIRLTMVGAGLHSSTSVRYAMQACRGRFPCISCGIAQSRRLADVTLHTKLTWDPSWRLRSVTTPLPVAYPKPCEVTWLGIDITRRFVAPEVEKQLAEVARVIDRNVPALTSVRPQAEQIWTALQTPYELAPRTWLVLEPSEVALSPVSGVKSTVTTTLHLRATTRVVVGDRPSVARKPLPSLRNGAVTTSPAGVRVPFDLELPYAEASRLATRDYATKTYRVNGKTLKLETIRVAPAANGRVLVEAMIDYRGGRLRNYRGMIFLEGTPRFDPATQSIVVPDLEFSLDPKRRGLFARIAERAAHDSIRARLRESARFALAPRIAEARAELTRALNRQLAPGVSLRGRADAVEPQAVTAGANAISLRIVAKGAAEVVIAAAPRKP